MDMFHTWPEDLSTLRMKVSDPSAPDHQAAQRLGEAIQGAMTKRLSDAKGVYPWALDDEGFGGVRRAMRSQTKMVYQEG